MPKKITRERAYLDGELVTIIQRGRKKSTIRTAHGFVREDVPNKELADIEAPDDENEPSEASFGFEVPSHTSG